MRRLSWPTQKNPLRVIGVISGTSADAIDVALVEVTARPDGIDVKTLATSAHEYAPPQRSRILDLCRADAPVEAVCTAGFEVGEWFAQAALAAVARAAMDPTAFDLIASHGQTIWHIPGHSTLQIGEAAVIAERTGLPVVSNFRARDIAAGGQGAPLVSYFDYLVFRDAGCARAVQNLGGIGNVTWLPAGTAPEQVISFDTGPGNMVIDGVMRLAAGSERDERGRLAAEGRPHEGLLAELLADPYFAQPPPKTTGREKFGQAYAERLAARGRALGLPAADLVATATMLTVRAVVHAYRAHLGRIDEVIVSGGGVHNATLMRWLTDALAPVPVRSSGEHGVDPDFKEAIAFAVLGAQTAWGRPGNVPAATGAARPVILGDLTPS